MAKWSETKKEKLSICKGCGGEYLSEYETSHWNKSECLWCHEWKNENETYATNEEREEERNPKPKFFITVKKHYEKIYEVQAIDSESAMKMVSKALEEKK